MPGTFRANANGNNRAVVEIGASYIDDCWSYVVELLPSLEETNAYNALNSVPNNKASSKRVVGDIGKIRSIKIVVI